MAFFPGKRRIQEKVHNGQRQAGPGHQSSQGQYVGIVVQADETVTFSCAKPGLLQGEGKHCTGRLTIGDIGIPEKLLTGCM